MKIHFLKLFGYDLLIHITFLFTILFFFFQFVGLKEERSALQKSLVSESKKILAPNPQFQKIKEEYQEMNSEDKKLYLNLLLSKIDDNMNLKKTNNNYYIGFGYFILVTLFALTFYFGFNFVRQKKITKIKLCKLILNNVILFSVICSIEVIFFFNVILKFQPITNTEINKVFTDSYNKHLNFEN